MIAWNDEYPAENLFSNSSWFPGGAHSKGLMAYDADKDEGIYVVHSFPKYPGILEDGSVNHKVQHS